jgi:glycosyltransferase involved in cell wall biosynthesis
MRITILGGPFQPMPPAPCGAIERVWHGLAEEFVRRGHAVTVLCRAHPTQQSDETIRGVRYVRRTSWKSGRHLGVNLLKDLAYSLRMAGLLPRADVLVTNAFWLPALASVSKPDAGLVAVHVGRMPKGQLPLYDRAARLQAVSGAVREAIVAQRPHLAAKVRVFPYPVDAGVFTPPPRPRQPGPQPVILYAGRIHPEKGVHLLVEAFAAVCRAGLPARLQVVGPWRLDQGGGSPRYLDGLKEKAAGLPVEFLEPVFDRRRLAAVYQGADLFCYPSLAEKGETFGVAPLEAMATGLTPVVSDLRCFRDFLADGENGLVFDHRAPDAAERLAAALAALLADPRRRQAMGERAARTAAALNYPHVADLYLADFTEMLKKGMRDEG